ncbi:MAG: hypothetical protein HYZ51_04205 [Candidatus Doudnabacteria bacterium]|nr:hypothetical protein [Candidatus Doudnabacteria bacterium]
MIKELSLPQIFYRPPAKAVRAIGLKEALLLTKALVIFLVILNAGLLLSNILGVNTRASVGYEIKSLQGKINAFSQENKKLNLQITEKASVSSLENELKQNGFSLVESAKFLTGASQFSQR